jgi:hypothetical protein
MHVKKKSNTQKLDPKQDLVCSLRKILLVCVFYKLEYPSYIGVVLPKVFVKACSFLFFLRHALGSI